MYNLKDKEVTEIQFFDHSYNDYENYNTENERMITILQYSANVIINDELVIQLSGGENEACAPSIPTSEEQYYNNKKVQDLANETLDIDDVDKFLENLGIENNYNFLKENATN